MLFHPYELVSFISNVMTLVPGDVVLTGTPGGIGPLAQETSSRFASRRGQLRNPVTDAAGGQPKRSSSGPERR